VLQKLSRLEISLIILGSVFLMPAIFLYPGFQPDYHLDHTLSEEEIGQRSTSILTAFELNVDEVEAEAVLKRNQPYFRKYVQLYGKQQLNAQIRNPENQALFYSWEISFREVNQQSEREERTAAFSDISLSLSPEGELLSLNADSLSITDNDIQAFDDQAFRESEDRFHRQLVEPVLQLNHWKDVRKDSAKFETTAEGGRHVTLFYSHPDAEIPAAVQTQLTATGKLISITYAAENELPSPSVAETLFDVTTWLLGSLFALFIVFMFINRLFNRLIDVRLLRFDAAAIGVLVLFAAALEAYSDYMTGVADLHTGEWLGMLIIPFVIAALAFVIVGTADSLNEEAWPEKKRALALIRHGYIQNDIVGVGIVRGVFAGFLMLGLATSLFMMIDTSWLVHDESNVFPAGITVFVLYDQFSGDLLFALTFVFIFLIVPASYLKIKQFNTLPIFAIVLAASGLFTSRLPETGNEFTDLLISLMVFAIPVFMYLKYDTLSAVIAIFVYPASLSGLSVLFTPGPGDLYLLIYWLLFIPLLLIVGFSGLRSEDDLSDMPELVPDYVKKLAREQRIKQEFSLAREVQEQFLTSAQPIIPGYDIAARCNTAYEVGGDYYDFIRLDSQRTLVVIADVSGKGIKAAFYMTLLKGYLQSVSEQHESVSDIMKTANRLFYENRARGTFITALAGILDSSTGAFEFVRAGHDPLFLIEKQKQVREFIPRGFALGMAKPDVFNKHLQVEQIMLQAEQTLLLFTDGYPESRTLGKKQLGEEGLKQIALKNNISYCSAAELLDGIHTDVQSFVGRANQHDDMTMIIICKDKARSVD
jgi:serine phosphatase RsbU (regulator of sigma subunit)